jgi:hypothetical protein
MVEALLKVSARELLLALNALEYLQLHPDHPEYLFPANIFVFV